MNNQTNFNNDFPNFDEFISSFNNETSSTSNENTNNSNDSPFGNIDISTFLKMKQIMEKMQNTKNDPRSNLLLSLKPYLKPSRKQKVDQYIQFFNMSNILENFGPMGGEKTK